MAGATLILSPHCRITMSTLRSHFLLILFCGGAMMAISLGLRQSFGLFLPSFTRWNGAETAQFFIWAIALQNVVWGIFSTLFGSLADRHGAARVAACGAIGYTLGLVLMAGSLRSPGGLLLGHLLIGLGLSGCGFSVVLGAVARCAPVQWRSQALGAVTAAGSLGQFLLVPVAGSLLGHFGWVVACVVMAIFALLMTPVAACLRERPIIPAAGAARQSQLRILGAALGNRDYLLLTTGFFVCGLQVVFITTHLPQYLLEKGIGPQVAAWTLSLIGLFNVFGTLACGWLGSRFPMRIILAWLYLLRALLILVFLLVPSGPATSLLFGALIGLLWLGTIPLTSGLVIRFFGTASMSMLFGFVFFSHQLGSFCGAWLGGVIHLYSGDYTLMWWFVIVAGVLAALLHYPIREADYVTAPLAASH